VYKRQKEVYAKEGKWKATDWFTRPGGIQQVGKELYPSWWSKSQSQTNTKMVFERVSKKKATDCTPEAAKIQIAVPVITDQLSKAKTYSTTSDGYDPNATDDTHQCSDVKPFANSIDITKTGSTYKITVSVTQGSHPLQTINVSVGSASAGSINATASGSYSLDYTPTTTGLQTVTATVTDNALYTSAPITESHMFN
jgi:penicillin-binding protein 1A